MATLNNNLSCTTNTADPVAIIGFGVAGYNAAAALRQHGYTGAIEIFSAHGALPYSPIMTSYYASGAIELEQCFPWSQEKVDRLALNIHSDCPVQKIDTISHAIHTEKGTFPYSKCIITSGSSAIKFPFATTSGVGALTLRTLEEARAIREAFANKRCKRVLISGASMVAVKLLEAALFAKKEVTLVGRQKQILSRTAFEDTAKRFEQNIAAQGAALMFNNAIEEIKEIADDAALFGRTLRVHFKGGETLDFDLVLTGHGVKGNLDFIDKSIACQEGILVDEFMRSNNPDIFAAGDVAQATEILTGEKRVIALFKNAAIQGQCAGKAVAAEHAGQPLENKDAYSGSLVNNTITCNGALFISAGCVELNGERHLETEVEDDMTIARLYEGERLIGFNISADKDEPGGKAYELGGMLTRQILKKD